MTLTPATLFRLWQRNAVMQRYALPARAVLRIGIDPIRGYDPDLGMEDKPAYRLADVAAVTVRQADAWERVIDYVNDRAHDAVSDGAVRLLDMTRYPNRFTRTELLANRRITGLSIRECERGRQAGQVAA